MLSKQPQILSGHEIVRAPVPPVLQWAALLTTGALPSSALTYPQLETSSRIGAHLVSEQSDTRHIFQLVPLLDRAAPRRQHAARVIMNKVAGLHPRIRIPLRPLDTTHGVHYLFTYPREKGHPLLLSHRMFAVRHPKTRPPSLLSLSGSMLRDQKLSFLRHCPPYLRSLVSSCLNSRFPTLMSLLRSDDACSSCTIRISRIARKDLRTL